MSVPTSSCGNRISVYMGVPVTYIVAHMPIKNVGGLAQGRWNIPGLLGSSQPEGFTNHSIQDSDQ